MTVTEVSTPINDRTRAMLEEASRLARVDLVVTQGRNPGGVAASAGTHDDWGVVDLRVRDFPVGVRNTVVLALRMVGAAAWLRTRAQGFDVDHIHAVMIDEPNLSPAARRQVTAYRAGRNGLANNGPDDGPKGYAAVTWENYLKAHPLEEEMNEEQFAQFMEVQRAQLRELQGINARMGYVANDGMKDLDAVRDKVAGND